jgi:hypothetical protein
MTVAARTHAERAAQGLPPRIADADALRAVARLLTRKRNAPAADTRALREVRDEPATPQRRSA